MQFSALRARSPDHRIGKRLAALGHTFALVAGVRGLTDDLFDPFALPKKVEPPKEQTWQDMLAVVEGINKKVGGLDLRRSAT